MTVRAAPPRPRPGRMRGTVPGSAGAVCARRRRPRRRRPNAMPAASRNCRCREAHSLPLGEREFPTSAGFVADKTVLPGGPVIQDLPMTDHPRRVTRALLSVSAKSGLIEFARALAGYGIDLVSTGGTAKAIAAAGLKVADVSDLTGFPEMMDGRVKTLHPKVHGGLLAIRDNAEHNQAMKSHGIAPIDLLVVNLYPFEATVDKGAGFEACIENIDIGGARKIPPPAQNTHRGAPRV